MDVRVIYFIPTVSPPPLLTHVYIDSEASPKTYKQSVGAKLAGSPDKVDASSPTTNTYPMTKLIK